MTTTTRTNAYMLARTRVGAAVAVLLVLLVAPVAVVRASLGDVAGDFVRCRDSCRISACPAELPWILRVMWWTCEENCGYTCMREHHDLRVARGLPAVQYYGKWPFVRVAGMQEILSVVFSLANLVPHAYYFINLSRMVPPSYPYLRVWRWYAAIAVNAWIWSAAFHARDFLLTERLDYFCATLHVLFSVFVASVRVFEVRRRWVQRGLLMFFSVLYTTHVGYMQFVRMDYRWNMSVSIAAGAAFVLGWLVWGAVNMRTRPYARKVVWFAAGLGVASAFEVFDFPPVAGLLDAHAVWHGLTPALSALYYSFIVDDANFHPHAHSDPDHKNV